jgi:hypothetical protein
MLHTLSPDEIATELALDELSFYERGLSLPEGENAQALMGAAVDYIMYGLPLPLDLQVNLEAAGVILDEFEAFVEHRIGVVRVNTRH